MVLLPFLPALFPSAMGERVAYKTIVVAGLGMVALSFIEKVREYDAGEVYNIMVFSEENHRD